jgi:hypothetical protein
MNPAGIALFRTDELVVTPSLRFAETDAGLPGSPALTDNKSTFAFDNFGLLFNDTPGENVDYLQLRRGCKQAEQLCLFHIL